MSPNPSLIHCIGDSHVSFFSGLDIIQPRWPNSSINLFPFFKVYRLGAVLAYNLCKSETTMRGREKLFEIVDDLSPGSQLLLCFGEIDCRAHLLKQAHIQGGDVNKVVADCVERYFSVISELLVLGFEVLIWNTIPSTRFDSIKNKEFPTYGSCLERNEVTKTFNFYLNEKCRAASVSTISIFDELVDRNGLTEMRYYMDMVHLSQKAMPLALKKFQEWQPEQKFEMTINYRVNRNWASGKLRMRQLISQIVNSLGLRPFLNFI